MFKLSLVTSNAMKKKKYLEIIKQFRLPNKYNTLMRNKKPRVKKGKSPETGFVSDTSLDEKQKS
jgi:hypothetical protein